MALLAEQPIERIGLAEIAERAGVTLAELRGEFGSPLAILAAQSRSSTARCWPGSIPTWKKNPRASGCSTC